MYDHRIYAGGIHSVLLADWTLTCETPLVIRNGQHLAYRDGARSQQIRYQGLDLRWRAKQTGEHEVTALHYGYEVQGGQVRSYHFVPPASVRGALRAWTMRHLVHPGLHAALNAPEPAAAQTHPALVQRGLGQRDTGCELVASLFGLAADESQQGAPSNAGRLRVETQKFAGAGLRTVDVSGVGMTTAAGPENVRREMPVRNPLDRMTHASRDAGLHRYLEVCRGEQFTVQLRIINPLDCDLGLIGLWVREMRDGMLRLGGLSSIGRGRVSFAEQSYELWRRRNAPRLGGDALLRQEEGGKRQNDILAGIWTRCVVPPDALAQFEEYVKAFTGGGDNALS